MCSMSVLCPLCAVPSFGSIDALQQRLIKAANGPLACPFPQCEELFLGLDKLTIHLFTHTSLMMMSEPKMANGTTAAPATATTAKRRAKKCKKATTVDSQHVEQPLANVAPASCDICEFNFRNSELRDMHFRLVHENVPEAAVSTAPAAAAQEPYKCHLCAKTFKMKGSLRVHLKVVHMLGLPYVNNAPKLNICDRIRHKETTAAVAALPLPATTTSSNNSNSTQPYALSGALGMLTLPPPAAVEASALSADAAPALVNSANDANPKIWECDVCAKCFTTKYFLKKHKRLHTGEMPYTCEICARTFTFQQSYHKHLLYHSEVKPHVCTVCGRAFKELSTLHNHERIHSGEKPFKCEVCGKCFRQRVSFLVHTRIHTGVMPYSCELCQKSFRYKVSQRTHKCAPALGAEPEHSESPEQFLKAFLECNGSSIEAQASPASAEIAAITDSCAATAHNEALLSQSIDDIVVESCQKLGICAGGAVSPLQQLAESPTLGICNFSNGSSNSPLQQLQRLRLYSSSGEQQLAEASELFGRFLMDPT